MTLHAKLDQLLRSAVDRGEVPGVAAVVVDRDSIRYEGAFGKRSLATDAPMTVDTVAWIASMTKAITAACAMQLVEQGKLDLHSPASQWVPMLAEAQVLTGWDADGKPIVRPPRQPVTLHHLLTHTAGFSYEFWNADILRYQQVMGIPGAASCERRALTTPMLFDPGERWEYGISIDFVGMAIEAVSGQTLSQYMRTALFEPIGMHDTAMKIRPDMRERLASMHTRSTDGVLAPMEFELPQEPEVELGGGALYSTARDYARFIQMVLNRGVSNGQRVLSADTVELMCRNAIGDLTIPKLTSVIPAFSNDVEFLPGLKKGWGYSWLINLEPTPTGRSAGSLFWAGISNSYFWIDPVRGIGGVYISQIVPFADTASLALFEAFETAVYEHC